MMLRQALVGSTPAPTDHAARLAAIEEALTPLGIYVRRAAHSAGEGMTVTHLHLSNETRGREAAGALCRALDWGSTDVSLIAGSIAISTYGNDR